MTTDTIAGAASAAGLAVARRCSNEPDGTPPTPVPPGPPSADPPLTPTTPLPIFDVVVDDVEAARFLTQATFGPALDDIEALVAADDLAGWIADQVAMEPSLTLPYVEANSNGSLRTTRHHIWWENAVYAPDQLRQRVAFALSELFVVSDRDYELGNSQYGMCDYYDMLAAESFGNFRTLLERVTLHPVMGIYLSMLRNERADPARNIRPDENYAREVMQLFTIGLWELESDGQRRLDGSGNPIPTYDQATVEEFAKVFTGWNFAGTEDWTSGALTSYAKTDPMVPFEEFHDDSTKELLNGLVIPAGGTARSDMTAALDNLFEHPNVGPFIATTLIRRLVTSNPTPAYVGRVAAVFADNGAGTRGDLRATVTAILGDAEARTGHDTMPHRFGKVKEPIVRITAMWRAFNAQPGPGSDGVLHPPFAWVDALASVIGQAPLQSPSVFNFFQPAHPLEADGELVAPEAQILSEINVASMNNLVFSQVFDNTTSDPGSPSRAQLDITREESLAADPAQLVEHLHLLLAPGALPTLMLDDITAHVESLPFDDDGSTIRVMNAIACIVGSPFHLVQK